MSTSVLERCQAVIKNGTEFQFRVRRSAELNAVLVRVYFRRNTEHDWQCANSLVLPTFAYEAFVAMFPKAQTMSMSATEARMV